MTDTPETDAECGSVLDANEEWPQLFQKHESGSYVDVDFVRKLERQRNEARADLAACRVALDQYRRECEALRTEK